MSTTSIPGGGNHNVNVYGNGTVIAGNGNNAINVSGSGNVLVGSGNNNIQIGGNATVSAGAGNNRIAIQGTAQVSVGGGNDTLNLYGSGRIVETGTTGHDSISLGLGNDTIYVQGTATVHGASHYRHISDGSTNLLYSTYQNASLGGATIVGGGLIENHSQGITEEFAVSGKATIVGGSAPMVLGGGTGSAVLQGGSGRDTFIGGSGHDTMTGVGNHNVFEFVASPQGGTHVITNFVSGDILNVEGHNLAYLLSHGEVTTKNGNTIITVDGGRTTIELKGVIEKATGQTGGSTNPHAPLNPHEPLSELRNPFGFRDDKF